MEQLLYGFTPGHDYPLPVVDLKTAAEQARERLWGQRQERDVQLEGMRILAKHVRSTHKDRWHGS